ncbi:MAG: T9SS type A sorting domain-containing protein [Bacteroidetes bacterium]|nr:T9SS type A sorting domain-containing protein [Bacteroidota bacterium]
MFPNTTYNVEVASYSGGVWSAYGSTCQITTGASVPRYAAIEEEQSAIAINNTFSFDIYPNPTNMNFTTELRGIDDAAKLRVYDVLGGIVSEVTVSGNAEELITHTFYDFAKGIYFVELLGPEVRIRKKLVVE